MNVNITLLTITTWAARRGWAGASGDELSELGVMLEWILPNAPKAARAIVRRQRGASLGNPHNQHQREASPDAG
jgi:hypothetical protein